MSIQEQLAKDQTNLYRPRQIDELKEERDDLAKNLKAAETYNTKIDGSAVRRRVGQINHDLEKYSPKPFAQDDKQEAVDFEKALREEIVKGMPTQAEMRRAPAGAVDKHMQWEARNKPLIKSWKILRQRLAEMGAEFKNPIGGTLGRESEALCNLELYRPVEGSMNMDNQVVQNQDWHNINQANGRTVTFTDEQMAIINQFLPDIEQKLALMGNEERQVIKTAVKETFNPLPDSEVKFGAEEPTKVEEVKIKRGPGRPKKAK